MHEFPFAGEWRDRSTSCPPQPGWQPGRFLYFAPTVHTLLEIFEFAARFAVSPAGGAKMYVSIHAGGLQGRRLISTDPTVTLRGTYVSRLDCTGWWWREPRARLIAQRREMAAWAAQDLFAQFGLEVDIDTIFALHERIS